MKQDEKEIEVIDFEIIESNISNPEEGSTTKTEESNG
tara:strand:+ start:1287 stop:1397 length:111 start_codon:yes stop_codon:yes gene_type:complete